MENLFYNGINNPVLMTCAILLLLFFLTRKSRPAGSPPSPPRLPFIGNLHQLTRRPNQALQRLAQKHGPLITFYVGSAPVYVVSSAELAREITVTQKSKFPARPKPWASEVLLFGSNDLFFGSCPNHWRQTRKLCVNELLSVRRVQSFRYIREEEVAKLVASIRCAEDNQCEINLGHSLLKLATDIVARAVLGQRYTAEGDMSEKMGALSRTATRLGLAFAYRDFDPMLYWVDHVTGFAGDVTETSRAMDAILTRVIDEHEAQPGDAGDSDDRKDFIDIILQLQKEDKIGLDLTRNEMKAILMDMFLAGTDTSATGMEWMMVELVRKPSTMKRVQEEIRRVVGHKSKIEESDIARMEYFQCVIKETLRLHGVYTMGRSTSSCAKIGGFEIPANATVLINTWAIHRDPEVWDMPLEFLPERFMNSSMGFKGQDSEYFPFGLGPRICPGIQFAATEIEHTMANLLCWFDWKLPDGITAETLDMSETSVPLPSKKFPLRLLPVPAQQTN